MVFTYEDRDVKLGQVGSLQYLCLKLERLVDFGFVFWPYLFKEKGYALSDNVVKNSAHSIFGFKIRYNRPSTMGRGGLFGIGALSHLLILNYGHKKA